MQAKSDFWKAEYDHETAKKAGAGKKAPRKTAKKTVKKKKKPSASDLLKLDDTSELEVALDSLGSFFNHHIDTDYYQADGANQAA